MMKPPIIEIDCPTLAQVSLGRGGALMVIRLAAADAVSLHTQTSTTAAHTVALIIMEASDQLSHDRLLRLVASSLPALARFRSRLVGKPLGMGQPVWAEIDDYDPTPRSMAQLFTIPAVGASSPT